MSENIQTCDTCNEQVRIEKVKWNNQEYDKKYNLDGTKHIIKYNNQYIHVRKSEETDTWQWFLAVTKQWQPCDENLEKAIEEANIQKEYTRRGNDLKTARELIDHLIVNANQLAEKYKLSEEMKIAVFNALVRKTSRLE